MVAGDDVAWFVDVFGGGDAGTFTPPTSYTAQETSTQLYAIGQLATRDNVAAGSTTPISGEWTGPGGYAVSFGAIVVRLPAAVDGTADQFTFNDDLNAPRSSTRTSNTITIAGLGAGVSVQFNVTGAGAASKNGSATLVTTGGVVNGDTIALVHNSSANYSTATSTTLDVNGVSDIFVSQTIAAPASLTINGNDTVTEGASIALESVGVTLTGATALYLRHGARKVNQANLTVIDADSATANHVLAVANVGIPFTTSRHAIYCGITVASVDTEIVVTHAPASGTTARTLDPASMASGDGSLFKNIVAYFAGLSLVTSVNDQCVVPNVVNSVATSWLADGSGNMTGFVDQGPQTGTGTARYWLAANDTWYDINFTLVNGDIDTIAPNLVAGPTISNITQTTADFAATSNDAGFYGIAVLPTASAVPADSAILAGTVSGSLWSRASTAMVANTQFTAAINGLTQGQSYRVHVALQDTAPTPNTRVVSSNSFTTASSDTTAPNLSAGPTISSIAQTTASLAATPDESGVYGIAILPSVSAAPADSAILAGTVSGSLWSRSSTAMTAATQFTAALTGLSQGQSYRAHIALRDTASVPNSRVVTSAIFTMQTVGDTTAPNFSAGPGIANLQSTSLDVTFTADEAGQYRIVMVPSNATPPLVDEVLAGTGSGGAAAASVSALLSMSAGAAVVTPLVGLTPGATYIPYVALRDSATTPNKRLGNAGPVTMTIVPDGIDPTIEIGVISLAATHTITATVSDNVGVVGVSFYVNGSPLGAEVLNGTPWQWEWNSTGYPAGNYSVTALARDAAGNTTLSNSVLVQIADAGLPDAAPISKGGRGTYEQKGSEWYRVEDKAQ